MPEPQHGMDQRKRLTSIDALRGVAALVVVVYHWQQFGGLSLLDLTIPFTGSTGDAGPPFEGLLALIYQYGWRAVDMFFVISGFIFFALYERRTRRGEMPARDFFVLRFSRLYPLHFMTLLVVAALQIIFFSRVGAFFVYPVNDVSHFIQSLFLINLPDYTFNAPAWTLTVEVLMYALFWSLARARILSGVVGPLAVVAAGAVVYLFYAEIGRGILGFFMGGVIYRLFTALLARHRVALIFRGLAALTAALWIILVWTIYYDPVLSRFAALQQESRVAKYLVQGAVHYGLFPLTVLTVALWEQCTRTRRWSVFEWLGAISYSSYLIHFPVALILATCAVYGAFSAATLFSLPMFFAFIAVVLILATLSHRWLEMPAQAFLRGKFLSRRDLEASAR